MNKNTSFFRYYTESAISHQQNGLVMQMIGAYCTVSSPMSQKKAPYFISQNNYILFFVSNV